MTFWAGVVLGGCLAGVFAGPSVAQPARLPLPGGQEVILPAGALTGVSDMSEPGLRLWLTDVTDQRCPSAKDCYWEGMIRAVIFVTSQTQGAQSIVLCNLCEDGTREAVVAGFRLRLERLEPEVVVIEALGRLAVLTDYTVMVTVSAAP